MNFRQMQTVAQQVAVAMECANPGGSIHNNPHVEEGAQVLDGLTPFSYKIVGGPDSPYVGGAPSYTRTLVLTRTGKVARHYVEWERTLRNKYDLPIIVGPMEAC